MIDELCERIWARDAFHAEFRDLQEMQLRRRFLEDVSDPTDQESKAVRLLRSAVAFASSSRSEHRQAAYKIVTAVSDVMDAGYPGARYAMLLVLNRTGNFPALSFAERRFDISVDSLPARVVAESTLREESNTVRIGEEDFRLTDFQAQLWRTLDAGASVGISAPTSAGKSFIMQNFARQRLTAGKVKNVGFVVPSRALINQVSEEVSFWLQSVPGIELVTTPMAPDTELPQRAVYVVTQERLQLLHMGHPELKFEVLVIDEAQSLADGPRGVVLASVIEEVTERNPHVQLLFAGPNLKAPSGLGAMFGRQPEAVKTTEPTVSQNILFLDCDPDNNKEVALSVLSDGEKRHLGHLMCDQPLVDHRSKLVNLTLRMGADGQNLIYALGPAECEKIAFGLADADAPQPSAFLLDLSEFIKEAVHPQYQLVQTVLRGVGFHYGRLPSLVRKTIEDAFADGFLRNLVTTSTLLHGVNLPAQNLFLHDPKKGDQPISSVDFWNLAGRAGRLGKEFSGNIFLIDYGDWQTDPMKGERESEVVPTLKSHLVDRTVELIDYVRDTERVPEREVADEFENTFVKLVRDELRGSLPHTLDKIGLVEDDPRRSELISALREVVNATKIDRLTIESSPTVSIHRQDALYGRISQSVDKRGVSYVMPKHPLDGNAYQSYVGAIKRLHDEVLKYPKTEKSHTYYAQLVRRWMSGMPLPRIIDGSYDYRVRNGQNPNIASVIRATLDEIEKDLRYKYVRLFSCYNAVLSQVLRDKSLDAHLGSIPALPMFLEMGACSTTMISFMGLGLSRFTAGKLSGLARRTDMIQSEARSWIRRQQVQSLDIPQASAREIARLLG